jgi:limonene 1,2-monooxygenase
VAPTRAEAERQVAYGIDRAAKYALRDASFLRAVLEDSGLAPDAPMIDIFRASQLGVIGTPEDAIEHIEHLQELSGGYGTHLIRVLDWANPRDTLDSYELFAREVMPHFQDSSRRREENWDTFSHSEDKFQVALSAANQRARERYEASRAEPSTGGIGSSPA